MKEPVSFSILHPRHRAEKAFIVCFVLAANWMILHAAASTQSGRFHELNGPLLDVKPFSMSWISSPKADTGSNTAFNISADVFGYEWAPWISLKAMSATEVDSTGASHSIAIGDHRTPLFSWTSGLSCGENFTVDLPYERLTPPLLRGQFGVQVNARRFGVGRVASVVHSSGDAALDKLMLASLNKCIGNPATKIGVVKQSALNVQYSWALNATFVCRMCIHD